VKSQSGRTGEHLVSSVGGSRLKESVLVRLRVNRVHPGVFFLLSQRCLLYHTHGVEFPALRSRSGFPARCRCCDARAVLCCAPRM